MTIENLGESLDINAPVSQQQDAMSLIEDEVSYPSNIANTNDNINTTPTSRSYQSTRTSSRGEQTKQACSSPYGSLSKNININENCF